MRKSVAGWVLVLLVGLLLLPKSHAQANARSLLEEADKLANDGLLTQARAAYEKAIQAGERVDTDYVRSRTLALCYLNGQPQNLTAAVKWFEAAIRLRPIEVRRQLQDARRGVLHALAFQNEGAHQYQEGDKGRNRIAR